MHPVLLHNHIFKNAGTSIDWALERTFGARFLDHRDENAMLQGGMPYVERIVTDSPQLVAISSHHMPFSPEHASATRRFWHLFMLRRPLSRALSAYRYEIMQRSSVSIGARLAKFHSMSAYFDWYLHDAAAPAVLRNFYTRYFCDSWHPQTGIGTDEFERALRNAHSPRVLVGIVERFDESMVAFEDALRGDFPEIDLACVRLNENNLRARVKDPLGHLREKLGEELFARLQEANAYDERIHQAANGWLDQRIAGIPDFQARLEDFRKRCTDLQLAMDKAVFILKTLNAAD